MTDNTTPIKPCELSAPEHIWLQPSDEDDEDGQGVKYVRGDVVERLEAELAGAKRDIASYLTTAMAAAVEIQEHWDAHCDQEGYGPVNLMRRLENGFPASYGYTAKTVVELTAERDELRAKLSEANLRIFNSNDVAAFETLTAMLAEAKAKLDALEKQEPVAIVAVDAMGAISVGWRKKPSHNDKLYLSAGAKGL